MVRGELQPDQQRRAERRHLDERLAPRAEGGEHGQGPGCDQDRVSQRLQAAHLAPDAEWGVAVGLVGEGAVDEGVEAGAEEGGEHDEEGHA